jgi:hypothetical protein
MTGPGGIDPDAVALGIPKFPARFVHNPIRFLNAMSISSVQTIMLNLWAKNAAF